MIVLQAYFVQINRYCLIVSPSLQSTDISPGLALCHAWTLILLATESTSKTAYIHWIHPCICTITNISLFREGFLLSDIYFTGDFDTLRKVVARPSFCGLNFLFLLATAFLLLLATILFLSCKLKPFFSISSNSFYIEMIGA